MFRKKKNKSLIQIFVNVNILVVQRSKMRGKKNEKKNCDSITRGKAKFIQKEMNITCIIITELNKFQKK